MDRFADPRAPDPPPPYRVEPAFPRLTFERPLDLCAAPGGSRLFVAQQDGKVYSFRPEAADDKQLIADFQQVRPELTALYGVAFHPKFEQNRQLFVCYVQGNDRPEGSFVSRFRLSSSDPPLLLPDSEEVLLRWWSGGHNGGCLKFGPDGCLYISTGDGGAPSPPDPLAAGQDLSNLLSCILRIDVDRRDPGLAYAIPSDNPFLDTPDARPEIFAYGFRNPWRMSFDERSGDLWVGDVGWQLWEMIYRVQRGGNYGWPVMEGPQPALPESPVGPTPIRAPTVSHPHSEAASITGGYVYRGQRLPKLQGAYIYGDFQSGTVWGLRHDQGEVVWRAELCTPRYNLSRLARAPTANCIWWTTREPSRSTGWWRMSCRPKRPIFPGSSARPGYSPRSNTRLLRRACDPTKSTPGIGPTEPPRNAGWRSRESSH